MADANLEEVRTSISRVLLAFGGEFENKLTQQRICDTTLRSLYTSIAEVRGSSNVRILTNPYNEGAEALPATVPLRHCESCLCEGVVEVGLNLVEILRQRAKPRYFTKAKPGQAPAGCHWICSQCTGTFVIRKRSSDLKKHLRDAHGFSQTHVQDVFNPRSAEALYEHFGPCTHMDAKKNEWDVSSEPALRAQIKPIVVEPALPDLDMIDFSSLSEKQNMKVGAKAPPLSQTPSDLGGQTLLGTTTSSSQETTLRGNKRAKRVENNLEIPQYAPHPADSEDMDTSLAGIRHFDDAFQNGSYLASGDSSGQNSLVLPHKPPLNSMSRLQPLEDFLRSFT